MPTVIRKNFFLIVLFVISIGFVAGMFSQKSIEENDPEKFSIRKLGKRVTQSNLRQIKRAFGGIKFRRFGGRKFRPIGGRIKSGTFRGIRLPVVPKPVVWW